MHCWLVQLPDAAAPLRENLPQRERNWSFFSSKAENKDILQKLVDKFNETHKDVTIKITAPADAGTVLKTRMAKNDMPDIVAMGGDNNYTEVESAGMLVDLSSEDYVSNI